MKLILIEESFSFFEKWKLFKLYFNEIYTRCCFSVLVFLSLFSLFWEYRNEVTVFLLTFQKNEITNYSFLISNEFFEIFFFNLVLCMSLSCVGACIFFLIHLLYFIKPGLYQYESQVLKKIVYFEIVLFIFTPFFLGYVFVPLFWSFILFLQKTTNDIGFSHLIELKSHLFIKTVFSFYFNSICIGQCFIVLIVLFYIKNAIIINILTYKKVFYFSFLFLSTLITPPDIYSQLFCTFVLISFSELICFYFCFMIKTKKKNLLI